MTKAERRVMAALADGAWHTESELRTTFGLLQGLYLRKLVEGMTTKAGATPGDRFWRARPEPSLD